jgi:nicotinamide mononucleotide transporter
MPASLAEWIAVALALAYVLLAIRQDRWCWPAAAASAAIYLVLFARGGLPMQAVLQAFYIVMAVYGWFAWRADHGQENELRVTRRPAAWHALAMLAVVGMAAVNASLLPGTAGLAVAFTDSFVAWGSVLATWMVARKVLENWLYWILFDAVAVGLYFAQGFHATAGLFVLYVILAVRGYLAWRKDFASPECAA